jgi:transporter family-2 protein
VTISALGTDRDLHLGLLALAMLAGASISLHQAAIGHISDATGDPVVASGITFAISGLVAVVAWLAVDHGTAPLGWSAPPLEFIGGLMGVVVVVSIAVAVATLGVLQLTLGVVAGQAVGALLLDLAAPVTGGSVTLITVVSVLLTLAAVAVSGMALERRRRS